MPSGQKLSPKNNTINNAGINWFWKITAKTYFFPAYYTLLAFLIAVIMVLTGTDIGISDGLLGSFLGAVLLMWVGIIYFFPLPIKSVFDSNFYAFILPIIFVLGIILNYYRTKKNIILKWLVITLFLLITLSFAGCAAMIFEGA